ncbi:MAG: hypothetical protein WBA45_00570 [Microthrixaceae bacterium]
MKPDVLIATELPTLENGGERLLQIARWLKRRGLKVEIVALGEGTRPDLERFRSVAPTTVVDRFRRRGIATLPYLLGVTRLSQGAKVWKLRRFLSRRSGATLLVHDPLAASLVRYAPRPFSRVIAAFPDSTSSLDSLRAEDRETLAESDGWLTSSAAQSAQIGEFYGVPVVELDSAATGTNFVDPDDLLEVTRSIDPSGAVVLVPSIGLWDSIDHAIEVASQLHHQLPDRPLRWVADTENDTWLAHHDLKHAGLDCVVQVRPSDDPTLLHDVAVVVRTGYQPAHQDIVLAAAIGAVPVRGMCTRDLPPTAPQTTAFAVEELTGELVALLGDSQALDRSGRALKSELAHLDLHHQIAQLGDLMRPDPRSSQQPEPVSG